MKDKPKDTLKVATLSATYNIILQISLRVVTFISNAFILRFISRDVLGVINVRLLLLYTTIQFLSREPFRRVSIGAAKTHKWPQVVNLISLSVPLSLVFGSFLSLIWYYLLKRPDEQLVADYGLGVISIFISVLIELMAEPLYVWAQIQSFIKFKVIADGLFLMSRTLIMVFLVYKYPENAIKVFCLAQITSSLLYLSLYYIYFIFIKKHNLRDFMPHFEKKETFIDDSLLVITLSFLKNTTLKQFLTEGERFVMTFLNVITFAEQGVYDVINNIGSLPARLVFQQIEESGFLLFTQKIDRQKSAADQNPNDLRDSSLYLRHFIKIMTLLGLIILIFGYNYSELALLIYGGQKLSENLGTTLLQWHCLYVLFIAINGITECFTFAAMSNKQMDAFNKKMITISVIFLISSTLFTKWFGCQGFIMANCLNMSARIAISLKFIDCYYGSTKVDIPLKGAIPHIGVNLSFLMSFIALFSLKTSTVVFREGRDANHHYKEIILKTQKWFHQFSQHVNDFPPKLMAFLCPVRIRRGKKKKENDKISSAPSIGRITGSASIETLVRVGIEKEHGLSPDSKMVVLHDFQPCVDDELEVKRGQIVNVLYQENDWVYVISSDNHNEGFIPHSYCAPIDSHLAALTLNVKHKKLPRNQDYDYSSAIDQISISKGTTNQSELDCFQMTTGADVHPFFKDPAGRYLVLYTFIARDENDVSVERGEFVTVLNKDDPDWYWIVRSDGQEGFIPSGFVCPADMIQGHTNIESNSSTTTNTNIANNTTQVNGSTAPAEDLRFHGTELVMLYDYKAQASDDLSVRRGDWIYADLNAQNVDGWLWAFAPKLRKYGFIPKAYARPPAMTSL